MQMQVARQGSMAEQQMHQQQLKALHDDLQAVRVNTCRPGLVNTFTPCSKECAYVEVAAATVLSSCALPLLPFTNYTLILWFICHLATHATIVHSQSICMHDQMLRYGTSFEHIWCSFDLVLPYAIQWIISCTVVSVYSCRSSTVLMPRAGAVSKPPCRLTLQPLKLRLPSSLWPWTP